jgi:hypothetical protein
VPNAAIAQVVPTRFFHFRIRHGRGARVASIRFGLLLAVFVALAGCGSKISEANYYRVQYGMTEDEVEDLLGPAHAESIVPAETTAPVPASHPATTSPAARKVKSWTRGGLVIRVTFDDGVVTGRSAGGIPAEAVPHPPATRAVAPAA